MNNLQKIWAILKRSFANAQTALRSKFLHQLNLNSQFVLSVPSLLSILCRICLLCHFFLSIPLILNKNCTLFFFFFLSFECKTDIIIVIMLYLLIFSSSICIVIVILFWQYLWQTIFGPLKLSAPTLYIYIHKQSETNSFYFYLLTTRRISILHMGRD